MSNTPLVSVIIITYNSAKYVTDALESVKSQTYNNIELIVSDDSSKDDTVQICEQWITANKSRFVNSTVITVEKNTGTAANCNRALAKSNGEWFKLLAGDDALFPNCIKDFVDFATENPEAKFILGNIREYKNTFDEKNLVAEKDMHFHNNDPILEQSAQEQFQKLIYGNSFIPPAVFNNTQATKSLGGYDEKYGIYEDTPFYAKLLKAGYKIYNLDKDVQKYRTSDSNIFANTDYLFNYQHILNKFRFQQDEFFQYYSREERTRRRRNFRIYSIMNLLGLRRNTTFNRTLIRVLHLFAAVILLDFPRLRGYMQKAKRVFVNKS